MPTCPSCKSDIDELFIIRMETRTYMLTSVTYGDPILASCSSVPDEILDYQAECPNCGFTIATNWRDAEKFLLRE
jgi:RNA polymerase subunit RPABC4/transcription elongation factor Spt4